MYNYFPWIFVGNLWKPQYLVSGFDSENLGLLIVRAFKYGIWGEES